MAGRRHQKTLRQPMKLLLIEDDRNLTDALQPVLRGAGYAVELAHNGIDGEFLGNELQPDPIILDLAVPGKNGLQVLRSWRAPGNRTPLLILTARDAWHARADGRKAAADDHQGQPFHTAELPARREAIGRRQQGQAGNELHWGGVTQNTDSQQATSPDRRILQLPGIDFRRLRYLMQHPQDVHS